MELSVLCRPQTCERPEKCAVTLGIIGTPSGDISVKSVSLAERSLLDSHIVMSMNSVDLVSGCTYVQCWIMVQLYLNTPVSRCEISVAHVHSLDF